MYGIFIYTYIGWFFNGTIQLKKLVDIIHIPTYWSYKVGHNYDYSYRWIDVFNPYKLIITPRIPMFFKGIP